MMLLTKANKKTLPMIGAGAALSADQIKVPVKFFDPCGRWTFYLAEFDPDSDLMYGFVVSPLGADCDELGYASFAEIKSVRGRFGLPMERDRHWNEKTTLAEVMSGGAR